MVFADEILQSEILCKNTIDYMEFTFSQHTVVHLIVQHFIKNSFQNIQMYSANIQLCIWQYSKSKDS